MVAVLLLVPRSIVTGGLLPMLVLVSPLVVAVLLVLLNHGAITRHGGSTVLPLCPTNHAFHRLHGPAHNARIKL